MSELDDILATGLLRRGCVTETTRPWGLERLRGTITEVSGRDSGATTLAVGVVVEAQAAREPCAWVARGEALPFPPDLRAAGVDLAALAVIRVTETLDAVERLQRSGAFGVVVADSTAGRLQPGCLKRLAVQARRHGTAMIFLTRKAPGSTSLGALVDLHVDVSRRHDAAQFVCAVTVQKDKRRAPTWHHEECCDAPPGLC